MKRIRLFSIAFILFVLSCNALNSLPIKDSTPTAESEIISNMGCPNPQPTQAEIATALDYFNDLFTASDWKISYTVMEYRVSVARKSEELHAVANFDYVIFCGVTNAVLDDYYTPNTFDIIFQYYDGHELQQDCRFNDLRLYEFTAKNLDGDYNVRFWAEILDIDHIRESLLVFPISDSANLVSYSEKLMPQLPSCE